MSQCVWPPGAVTAGGAHGRPPLSGVSGCLFAFPSSELGLPHVFLKQLSFRPLVDREIGTGFGWV
jgi:hypothetical protein